MKTYNFARRFINAFELRNTVLKIKLSFGQNKCLHCYKQMKSVLVDLEALDDGPLAVLAGAGKGVHQVLANLGQNEK